MIEFSNKFCVNVLLDRAVINLCLTFQEIALEDADDKTTSLSPTYENATVLKLFAIYRQIRKDKLSVSKMAIFGLKQSIDDWEEFCERVNIDIDIEKPLVTFPKFLNMKTITLFEHTDIMAFCLVLQDYSKKKDNIREIVDKHFC